MADSSPSRPEQETEAERSLWRASGMGIELVGSVAGMAALGWVIDRWQGTMPLWTLILLGVGMMGGGYNFFRQAMAMNRKAAAAYRAKRAARGPEPEAPPRSGNAAGGMFQRTDHGPEVDWDDDDDSGFPGKDD